ncbi:hypothetical protein HDU76_001040, partial [Blyttiomyces sp. JEL0837]
MAPTEGDSSFERKNRRKILVPKPLRPQVPHVLPDIDQFHGQKLSRATLWYTNILSTCRQTNIYRKYESYKRRTVRHLSKIQNPYNATKTTILYHLSTLGVWKPLLSEWMLVAAQTGQYEILQHIINATPNLENLDEGFGSEYIVMSQAIRLQRHLLPVVLLVCGGILRPVFNKRGGNLDQVVIEVAFKGTSVHVRTLVQFCSPYEITDLIERRGLVYVNEVLNRKDDSVLELFGNLEALDCILDGGLEIDLGIYQCMVLRVGTFYSAKSFLMLRRLFEVGVNIKHRTWTPLEFICNDPTLLAGPEETAKAVKTELGTLVNCLCTTVRNPIIDFPVIAAILKELRTFKLGQAMVGINYVKMNIQRSIQATQHLDGKALGIAVKGLDLELVRMLVEEFHVDVTGSGGLAMVTALGLRRLQFRDDIIAFLVTGGADIFASGGVIFESVQDWGSMKFLVSHARSSVMSRGLAVHQGIKEMWASYNWPLSDVKDILKAAESEFFQAWTTMKNVDDSACRIILRGLLRHKLDVICLAGYHGLLNQPGQSAATLRCRKCQTDWDRSFIQAASLCLTPALTAWLTCSATSSHITMARALVAATNSNDNSTYQLGTIILLFMTGADRYWNNCEAFVSAVRLPNMNAIAVRCFTEIKVDESHPPIDIVRLLVARNGQALTKDFQASWSLNIMAHQPQVSLLIQRHWIFPINVTVVSSQQHNFHLVNPSPPQKVISTCNDRGKLVLYVLMDPIADYIPPKDYTNLLSTCRQMNIYRKYQSYKLRTVRNLSIIQKPDYFSKSVVIGSAVEKNRHELFGYLVTTLDTNPHFTPPSPWIDWMNEWMFAAAEVGKVEIVERIISLFPKLGNPDGMFGSEFELLKTAITQDRRNVFSLFFKENCYLRSGILFRLLDKTVTNGAGAIWAFDILLPKYKDVGGELNQLLLLISKTGLPEHLSNIMRTFPRDKIADLAVSQGGIYLNHMVTKGNAILLELFVQQLPVSIEIDPLQMDEWFSYAARKGICDMMKLMVKWGANVIAAMESPFDDENSNLSVVWGKMYGSDTTPGSFNKQTSNNVLRVLVDAGLHLGDNAHTQEWLVKFCEEGDIEGLSILVDGGIEISDEVGCSTIIEVAKTLEDSTIRTAIIRLLVRGGTVDFG